MIKSLEKKNFLREYGSHSAMLAVGLIAAMTGGHYLLDSLEIAHSMDSCQGLSRDFSQWLCAINLYASTTLEYGDTNSRLWIDPAVTTLGVVLSGFATKNMLSTAVEYFSREKENKS